MQDLYRQNVSHLRARRVLKPSSMVAMATTSSTPRPATCSLSFCTPQGCAIDRLRARALKSGFPITIPVESFLRE
jgi:hypothetical protein